MLWAAEMQGLISLRLALPHPSFGDITSFRSDLGGAPMQLLRRTFVHLAAAAAVLPLISSAVTAQTYPSRPVRIIVGQAAGSSSECSGAKSREKSAPWTSAAE